MFVTGSLIAFFVLRSIINHEFNRKLIAEKEQVIYQLHNNQDIYYLNIGDQVKVTEVSGDPGKVSLMNDTIMFDPYERAELPFRTLTFSDHFKGKHYIITITKSLLPNQYLVKGISEIMLGILGLLLLSLAFLNRFIFKKLWKPFHHLMGQLKAFNITRPEPISLGENKVKEFDQLKSVLDNMISKSIKDYKTLKEYTENTSHEIQTPLAVIKNKAEILLQEPLSEIQLNEVGKIYEAAGRLSRLKEGLALLSKIDNNQYIGTASINIPEFVQNRLRQVEELIQIKQLNVTTKYDPSVNLALNDDLAYILFTNLISNAIKHNVTGGTISIVVADKTFKIENTGKAPAIPTEMLFDRFKRSGDHAESIGLGLSLVKRIVDLYHMRIAYTYENPMHSIVLYF